jgi:hypothetical protein
MFGPSVKSVPGWWVSIVPMLIGVPVALTPGFVPHADVSTDPLLLLLAAPALLLLEADVAPPPLLLLLELLLLPQAASANSATAAMNARANRVLALEW